MKQLFAVISELNGSYYDPYKGSEGRYVPAAPEWVWFETIEAQDLWEAAGLHNEDLIPKEASERDFMTLSDVRIVPIAEAKIFHAMYSWDHITKTRFLNSDAARVPYNPCTKLKSADKIIRAEHKEEYGTGWSMGALIKREDFYTNKNKGGAR